MELSAQACRSVEFREKKYGYDPRDVDAFLEDLAVAIERSVALVRSTAAGVESDTQQALRVQIVTEGTNSTDPFQRALLTAQTTADRVVAEAHDAAAQIIASAHAQADDLLVRAMDRAHRQLGKRCEP